MTGRFERTEIDRRLSGLVSIGIIKKVDVGAAQVRVEIGDLVTGWLPVMALRAGNDRTWAMHEVGDQVAVIAPSGDLANGLVIGAIYSDEHPAPADSLDVVRVVFGDGAAIEYDRAAHRLAAHLPSGGTVDIIADGGVTIKGDVTVEGDVIARGVSLINHVHGGIKKGGSNTERPVK